MGLTGRSVGRLGRCGLAPAAQGRRPIAPAALLVRQHRPTICGQACPWPEQGAADIIGLYLNPPENALVLSVDEKPTIQALERASGYVLTSSGKIVHGLKSTYKRHGTVNLYAALEMATGVIRGIDHADQETRRFPALYDRPDRRATARSGNPCHPRPMQAQGYRLGMPTR